MIRIPFARIPHRSAAPPKGNLAERLHFLDILRGLAALAVFVTHAGGKLSPAFHDFTFTRFEPGNFGVMLFFLCSGFIIPLSLERHGSLHRFWINRVFRLYPLFWFSIATALPFATWSVPMVLANLTMFPIFLGYTQLIGVYWTLAFELLFYLVMSLLFAARLNKHTVPTTVMLILMAILAEAILPLAFGQRFPIGIIRYLATMFVGTVAYRVYNRELRTRPALVMMIATTVGSPSDGGTWAYLHFMTAGVAAYLVFAATLFIALRSGAQRASVARGSIGRRCASVIGSSARYLGRVSYSLYLMHQFVLSLVPPAASAVPSALVWLVLSLGLASLTYYLIEQPGIALGRRFIHGAATRITPAVQLG